MTSMWLHHQLATRVLPGAAAAPFLLRAPLTREPLSYYPALSRGGAAAAGGGGVGVGGSSSGSSSASARSNGAKSGAKKLFPCPYPNCSQTSSNKGNLSKHIATRHEHRKDFVCPFNGCNRRFAKKYNMLRHLSASGVHRASPMAAAKMAGKRRASDRAKWSSMELDLAKFLAEQCRPGLVA